MVVKAIRGVTKLKIKERTTKMLNKAKTLKGYKLHSLDGEI